MEQIAQNPASIEEEMWKQKGAKWDQDEIQHQEYEQMTSTTWHPQKGQAKNLGSKLINKKLPKMNLEMPHAEHTQEIPPQLSKTKGKPSEEKTHILGSAHYARLVQLIDDRWDKIQAETRPTRSEDPPELPGRRRTTWKGDSPGREPMGTEGSPKKGL